MKNGLYFIATKQFLELRDREDLKGPEAQKLMEENYLLPEAVICGCSLGSERKTYQKSVKSSRGLFTCRRPDGVRCPSGCFSNRLGAEWESKQVRSVGILEPLRAPVPPDAASENQKSSSNRDVYDTFNTYGCKVLSLGTLDACRVMATGVAELRNPSAAEVFAGIDRAIRRLTFSTGVNGYEAAAARGDRLRFGLVFKPVVIGGMPVNQPSVYWWRPDGTYALGKANADPMAMAGAIRNLQICENYRQPPYFILAVERPEGLLARVFVYQVAVSEAYLFPTESGVEAFFVSQRARSNGGVLIIKPVDKRHLQGLLESLGIKLIGFDKWPFRPDAVGLKRGKNGLILLIREVRGKKPGDDPDYDAGFEVKVRIGEALKATVEVDFKPVDGSSYRWCPPVHGPESWGSTYVTLDPSRSSWGGANPKLPRNADQGANSER